MSFELLALVEVGQDLGAMEQHWINSTGASLVGFNSHGKAGARIVEAAVAPWVFTFTADEQELFDKLSQAHGLKLSALVRLLMHTDARRLGLK
jgi:hypothetical protein